MALSTPPKPTEFNHYMDTKKEKILPANDPPSLSYGEAGANGRE